MGLISRMGLTYEHSIILWTLMIQLLSAVSILIAYRMIHGKNTDGPMAVRLFTWAELSPTLTFTSIEFPRYAFALAFMPFWAVGLANKRWLSVSLVAVLLSFASHRAMIVIAGLAFRM